MEESTLQDKKVMQSRVDICKDIDVIAVLEEFLEPCALIFGGLYLQVLE